MRAKGPRHTCAALLLVGLCCGLIAAAEPGATPQATHGSDAATSHRSFADVEHWQSVFDDPAREAWQKPAQVVAALQLRPGMRVADLGAGTGYFLGRLSAEVGPTGTVLAVEPEPAMVAHLRSRAEREETDNVVPILASFDNPRLPAESTDLILVVDTYHHIDDRRTYLRRLHRFLKRGGRVAFFDWYKKPLPEGPPLAHKLARQQVVEEMTASGFELVEQLDFLPYQYFLIFQSVSPRQGGRPEPVRSGSVDQ